MTVSQIRMSTNPVFVISIMKKLFKRAVRYFKLISGNNEAYHKDRSEGKGQGL